MGYSAEEPITAVRPRKPPAPDCYDLNGHRVVPREAGPGQFLQRRIDLCATLLPQALSSGPGGAQPPRQSGDPAFTWSVENWQRGRGERFNATLHELPRASSLQKQFGYQVPSAAPPPGSPRRKSACSPTTTPGASRAPSPILASPAHKLNLGFASPPDTPYCLSGRFAAAGLSVGSVVAPDSPDGGGTITGGAAGGGGAACGGGGSRLHVAASPSSPSSPEQFGGLRTTSRQASELQGLHKLRKGSLSPAGSLSTISTRRQNQLIAEGSRFLATPQRVATPADEVLLPSRAGYHADRPLSRASFPRSPPAMSSNARSGWEWREGGSCNGWEWPSARFTDTRPNSRAATPAGAIGKKSRSARDTKVAGQDLRDGRWEHWKHPQPFEVAREKEMKAQQLADRAAGHMPSRPVTAAH